MPYVNIVTTKALNTEEKQELHQSVLDAAALLGKSSAYVMVHLQDQAALQRGEDAGYCAYCDAQVLGQAPQDACNAFAKSLSDSLARIAQTAPGSVYLSLTQMELCYMDGRLLAPRKA